MDAQSNEQCSRNNENRKQDEETSERCMFTNEERCAKQSKHKDVGNNFFAAFADQKTKFIAVTVTTSILFILLVVFIVVFLLTESDEWFHDKYQRYLRLIPSPNGPRNMIRFRHGTSSKGHGWQQLTHEMKSFLKQYDSSVTLTGLKNITYCEEDRPPEGQVCYWNTEPIERLCKSSDDFGYPKGTPCIFLEFKRRYNFEVEPYTLNETHLLTENSLTNYRIGQSYLFLECKGNTVVDIQNSGRITYAPSTQEFPRQFFPFTGHPDYLSPFIALKFENPVRNIVIGITCRLWAKNLTHDQGFSPAELPFNLLVE